MKMEYRLLFNNKKGFLMTRKPEILDDELIITFTDSPNNATAIFENSDGNSLYRLLKDETCSIPKSFLKAGVVKVTITVLDGTSVSPAYVCEGFFVNKQELFTLIHPEGIDVEKLLIDVLKDNEELKEKEKRNAVEIQELREKIDKLIEGYDFD